MHSTLSISARRGVILLVVVSLLTLFAIIGLSFVLYAESAAKAAQFTREAQAPTHPDVDPEVLLTYFLRQLIYDAEDEEPGVYSALRGHSLSRLLRGAPDARTTPVFGGVGRLHTDDSSDRRFLNRYDVDDYFLVNYTYYPSDDFIRDPERLGRLGNPRQRPVDRPRGPFVGGANVPYTFPDLNNMFLAAVRADGSVLLPSFHRPWTAAWPGQPATQGEFYDRTTGELNAFWRPNGAPPPWFKYSTLRPLPALNAGFPPPADGGGDVKNLVGSKGTLIPYSDPNNPQYWNNDSIWLDLGFPVLKTPDGRKFKPLFAPLIVDLDNRINVNVHGNVRGFSEAHASNHGLGPWEVNLGHVLNAETEPGLRDEWRNLFLGAPTFPFLGRYGEDQLPGLAGRQLPRFNRAHYYAQLDLDAFGHWNEATEEYRPPSPLWLPGLHPSAPPDRCFPGFEVGYENGSDNERLHHPVLGNAALPQSNDRLFRLSDMEALLRYGDTGAPGLTSELFRVCPKNFGDHSTPEAALASLRRRNLVTTLSGDHPAPGFVPGIYDATEEGKWVHRNQRIPNTDPNEWPLWEAQPFPPLRWATANPRVNPGGDFHSQTWQIAPFTSGAASMSARLDLSQLKTPYPLWEDVIPPHMQRRYDDARNPPRTLENAQRTLRTSRQIVARLIYDYLVDVVRVPPANPGIPTDAELGPRRWLAQLAVNIVDFLDDDDFHTPFNFYTYSDARMAQSEFDIGAPISEDRPDLPRYWVFGTELPRVVLNEVLAENKRPDPSQRTEDSNRVWVELHCPMHAPPTGGRLQQRDGYPVPLFVPGSNPRQGYAPYKIVLANRILPGSNNVLGEPDELRAQTQNLDFSRPAVLVHDQARARQSGWPGPRTQIESPYIDVQRGAASGGFFLIGPPDDGMSDPPPLDLRNALQPDTVVGGTIPANTPLLRSQGLQYRVTYDADRAEWVPNDERNGVTVLLRRLANPHMPPNSRPAVRDAQQRWIPNPDYNPYITIDYLEKAPLQDATNLNLYRSRGKRQPYAARTNSNVRIPTVPTLDSPVIDQEAGDPPTQHTFGRPNTWLENNKPTTSSGRYDWLVHLDRELTSPIELLHVSGYAPHELTQRFIRYDLNIVNGFDKFQHRAPWLDQRTRLYRALELFAAPHRNTSMSNLAQKAIPGKINLNTVWDIETFRALCDASNANHFTQADVDAIWTQLQRSRMPTSTFGENNRPFWALGIGYTPAGDQFPRGTGIEDTLLRTFEGNGGQIPHERRLLQPDPVNPKQTDHPYVHYELLNKIFNNVTTRSNVFAVWVTVGFFEVTDDTRRPVQLGAEMGSAENRQVRRRLFAIVDRTGAQLINRVDTFSLYKDRAVVPYFSIIE